MRGHRSRALLTLLALCVLSAGARPFPAIAGIGSAPCPPGFTSYMVHGAELLFKRPAPGGTQGSIFAVMLAGSGDQRPDEAHCAHITEHMVFRNRLSGGSSLADFVSLHKGIYNGWTGPDHTQYEVTVPTEYIARALGLLVEGLFPATIGTSEYSGELNTRLKPELQYMTTNEVAAPLNAFRMAIYSGTVYAEKLFETPVTTVPADRVLGYMRREYSPQRLVVVVVADADPEAVRVVLDEALSAVPAGDPPESRLTALSPPPVTDLLLPDVSRPLILAGIGFGSVREEDTTFMSLACYLLMDRATTAPPAGLKLAEQMVGLFPLQGARLLMVGYTPTGETAIPEELRRLGLEATRALSDAAVAIAGGNVDQDKVTELVTGLTASEPRLPAAVPATLVEAWQAGMIRVPGVGMDMAYELEGLTPEAVLAGIVEAAARYAGSICTTVLIVRKQPTSAVLWVGSIGAVLAAVVAFTAFRRRRAGQARPGS